MTDRPKLLSVKEAAEYLNDTERFVRYLIWEKRIPTYKFGRRVRIDENDLVAFLAASRVEAEADAS